LRSVAWFMMIQRLYPRSDYLDTYYLRIRNTSFNIATARGAQSHYWDVLISPFSILTLRGKLLRGHASRSQRKPFHIASTTHPVARPRECISAPGQQSNRDRKY
jgi:hypothetical protein